MKNFIIVLTATLSMIGCQGTSDSFNNLNSNSQVQNSDNEINYIWISDIPDHDPCLYVQLLQGPDGKIVKIPYDACTESDPIPDPEDLNPESPNDPNFNQNINIETIENKVIQAG